MLEPKSVSNTSHTTSNYKSTTNPPQPKLTNYPTSPTKFRGIRNTDTPSKLSIILRQRDEKRQKQKQAMLKNVDSKEELEQIGELLSKALEDGKISSKEWLAIGGKNGLGILGGK